MNDTCYICKKKAKIEHLPKMCKACFAIYMPVQVQRYNTGNNSIAIKNREESFKAWANHLKKHGFTKKAKTVMKLI